MKLLNGSKLTSCGRTPPNSRLCLNKELHSFTVAGCEIPVLDSVKLLGIHIDSNLNFHKHISNICIKVSRQVNDMARVSKYLDLNGKMNLYHGFIMSNVNYCNTVWHFCSNHDIIKLEKLHMRALRVTK